MPRHLAIGDIHGCFDALTKLVEFVKLREDDVIVTLGDYINRGPDSRDVVTWLIEQQHERELYALKGNHEVMLLNAREAPHDHFGRFLNVGGDATLRSYTFDGSEGMLEDIPDEHWEFFESLLPYHQCDSHFFVHANAYPDFDLEDQPDYMLYWQKFDSPPRHTSGKIMICGHTSQKGGLPKFTEDAICIDTCAYRGGWLSCLCVETGFVWQANQAGETRSFYVHELCTDG